MWWRSRTRAGPRAVALAVLAPLATAVAYVTSEVAALYVLAFTGPISTITAAMRASGGRAAVWFTGPGPARQP
ncbi:hypothetical protein [Streptomyces katrae]|uniref:hypothetical protein n=1 Tax=Streptomyces katrae TaxID=68223 RepID=UPI0004C27419|nr:hypothetical protein [Streptomyces katrae]